MSGTHTDGPPRNYFSLDPPARVRRESPEVPHDHLERQRLTGELELALDALTAVHVGTGQYVEHEGRLVKEQARRAGRLVIPGTSLKGCCRQVYEALTDSDEPFARESAEARSAAAALFGALGYQGRVSFDDAEPQEPAAPAVVLLSVAYPPGGTAGRRFYGLVPAGARQEQRIPAFAIPAGTRLFTRLRLRNVTESETGALLVSLGVERFVPRLGGGRYDGYGCVRVQLVGVRLRPRHGFGRGDWQRDPAAVAGLRDHWLAAFTPSGGGPRALRELCAKLAAPDAAPAAAADLEAP